MLVLAQDWRWANDRGCVWTARAWPQLQRDIAMAMEWLCYLSGKTLDHFLDEWQCAHRGQEKWAQLHTILPFEFFTDRKYFLEIAPHYLATYNSLLPEAERLEGTNLKGTVDRIRSMNYPFDSFLSAFRQLHEELSYGHDRNGGLYFRELRPLDYYSLLALRAEGSMRNALEGSGRLAQIPPKKHVLTTYIADLAGQRGLCDKAIACFLQKKSHTDLKATPAHPIHDIRMLAPKIGALEDCLIRAFLCCVLARNYFAHHYYLDRELLHSDQSEFMLSGILVTVLHLL